MVHAHAMYTGLFVNCALTLAQCCMPLACHTTCCEPNGMPMHLPGGGLKDSGLLSAPPPGKTQVAPDLLG